MHSETVRFWAGPQSAATRPAAGGGQKSDGGGSGGDFVTSGRPVFVGLPNIAVVGSVASNIIPTPNFSIR